MGQCQTGRQQLTTHLQTTGHMKQRRGENSLAWRHGWTERPVEERQARNGAQ